MSQKDKISRRAFIAGLGAASVTGACTTTYDSDYSPKRYNLVTPQQAVHRGTDNVKVYNASYTQPEASPQSFRANPKGKRVSADVYALTGKVDHILVKKSARKMYLLSGRKIVRKYDIELGFNPKGHKRVQGDGRTPEGTYYIDRRNDYSKFYLSLGISYPNSYDVASAARLGMSPGGDIFIHGDPNGQRPKSGDWTNGCIAVSNAEMDELWQLIPRRTPITIRA